MPTAVVTGANSGIGHAFAQILISEGYEVHVRLPNSAPALPRALTLTLRMIGGGSRSLDVRAPESIAGFAAQLANKPVDVLLNVAGVMAQGEQDALGNVTKDSMTRIFETNTFGPLLLTQALLENISQSQSPRIGIVSSRVGSIQDNSTGGSYAYRASKAAVNSIGKSLAMDLQSKGVVVSLLHPGIVVSNLNPAVEGQPEAVQPEEAATKLWAVFMSKGMEETGKFWHREGYELPW
ncbi:1-hydroxy-2-glutathionyl-2-methyl-3-butene dehydrogenase [Fulvia fulva]|uniref:1-hydroxy-2-glutathionyl-2-methyl-3-butene dehydrogenase n=1 Tax=Passalora fulva TaxID=5499 RepID=A0A9Q8L9R5_PASFU|nr:1-hydroxy-2-glutathionyl-2-methyl-3-butene dehydrogenase [Fulvia fulva]KAK4634073.1 1-hydroxy-2-glutathionyl-2-methyl-3-butene dehydrogenase [Fulvia fulva]KAK4636853.1 1-hydroxy-2-glutathionyl-2-methyl-3-butene dehydrogenase [Fulvia fulva]UJO12788.1 1-hydroxy-2-glutathionyl-2-methyl-3-butene dehydrogenase [Fulvia fulva]WPV10194.1 1-hydroxy-2-glutathionyl-2-methyl-3-butene dehydrogenase [Fulvia fulva]WPV24253.1 1-hydroxy-2-glutathionyl-2-methyl-3-butene dehydrogenase [Fulvia fulva]